MLKNKKVIIYAVIGVVILVLATTGTIFALNAINKKNDDKVEVIPTKSSTDTLRNQAEAARKKNETEKARALLLEAQQQVKDLPKTDENTNAQVDIEAQLYLLEHSGTSK